MRTFPLRVFLVASLSLLAATSGACHHDGGESDADGGGAAASTGSGGSSGAGGSSASTSAATAASSGSPPMPGWAAVKIGGGGTVTGGTVSSDGTKFFRTDTAGGYLYDDATGRFVQVVPQNLPAATSSFWNGSGVFEALIAWSDPKVLVAAYDGALYRSTDAGVTFAPVKTGMSFSARNGVTRERHGQIDPHNPSHILFGDQVGFYRSIDGGGTWSQPSGLPPAAALLDVKGFSGVAFNPGSPLVGGNTAEAIASTGGKFFRSTDGGQTWTDISAGGPNAEPHVAEFDGKGRYVTAVEPHGVWQYAAGAWKNLGTQDASGTTTVVIDPANADHYVINSAFSIDFQSTTNAGGTWTDPEGAPASQSSVDGIPWHTTNPHYSPVSVLVDSARGVAWFPGGNQGVASIPLAKIFGAPPYVGDMHGLGLENMCANVLVAPVGSPKLHAAVDNETYAALDRANVAYPSVVNDVPNANYGSSFGLDVSREDPHYLARWISDGNVVLSGWTDDGGATWQPFTTMPAGTTSVAAWGNGATVAYSGKDNIIVVSSTGNTTGPLRMPYYTLDRGATWKPVTLPTPWTYANLALLNVTANREILVADRSLLGRFYFYVHADDATFAGVYRTDDGGVTWTRVFQGSPGAQAADSWQGNTHLESPVTNHLWMSAGTTMLPMGGGQLFRSTDGGATFTPLPGVGEPAKLGFGAPAHPGGYPVLFFEGYYENQPGVWMSANADAASPTWLAIGAAPNHQFAVPSFIAGDPDAPGRVWIATGCQGVQVGEFGDLLP